MRASGGMEELYGGILGPFWSFFQGFSAALQGIPATGRDAAREGVIEFDRRSVMKFEAMRNTCWRCALVVAGLVTFAVPAMMSDDLCGATIVDDLELDHDLSCTANGLVAGADGINIDLNGYSISGSGTGIGIDVTGRNDVTISGGAIRDFTAGVRVLNSADLDIKGVAFLANNDGIDLQAGSV